MASSSFRVYGSTEGLDELIRGMDADAAPRFGVADVSMAASSGVVTTRHGRQTEFRSAGTNTIIIRKMAKDGRDVLFLSPQDQRRGIELWRDLTDDVPTRDGLMRAARAVSRVMADAYRRNIDRRRTERGAMPPLAPSYKRVRDWRYGAGRPPLKRTGQLYDAITGVASVR